MRSTRTGAAAIVAVACCALGAGGGCVSPAVHARVQLENQELRAEKQRLERTVLERDGTIAQLKRQIDNLTQFDQDHPPDLFAPVKIEFARLTGGANYDDTPGDDGVSVYIRPVDADGNVVKVPGRITVQLTDLTRPDAPRLLAVCTVAEPEALRKIWYGRFGTDHYTVKCPFQPDVELPASRKVVVRAEFAGYLTGRVLTAVREVDIAIPGGRESDVSDAGG